LLDYTFFTAGGNKLKITHLHNHIVLLVHGINLDAVSSFFVKSAASDEVVYIVYYSSQC